MLGLVECALWTCLDGSNCVQCVVIIGLRTLQFRLWTNCNNLNGLWTVLVCTMDMDYVLNVDMDYILIVIT